MERFVKNLILLMTFLAIIGLGGIAQAIQLPTLGSYIVSQEGQTVYVKIEWNQADAADYGYVVTRQGSDGEKVLVELDPAPAGNRDVSAGGAIIDRTVVNGQTYTYNIYPYQRNTKQIGDDFGGLSRAPNREMVGRAFAAGSRPALSITVPVIPGTIVTTPPPTTTPTGICAHPTQTDWGWVCNVGELVGVIMRWALPLIASLALIMFIYAGYLYMTSRGNQDQIKTAKEVVIGVITGIILLLTIRVLLNFIGITS